MKNKKKALGRGLEAILQSPDTDITSSDISGNYVVGAIANIEIAKIETNPFQPRTEFDEVSLNELAQSINQQGIIQPITIRKVGFEKYQLISGERRYRASILAGLEEIPAFIRVANDEQMLEMALVENIHREDLNAIEIAISYNRLIEECKLTQEELSKNVGKNRTTISNYIRLLKLPAEIQIAIKNNQISMGHARAMINVSDDSDKLSILRQIIENELSVRQVENLVRAHQNPQQKKPAAIKQIPEKHLSEKEKLIDYFNTRVDIKCTDKGSGNILISFSSDKEFDRILALIKR